MSVAIRGMKRQAHGTSGSLSSAMLEVQSLLEPGKRHVVEVVQDEKEDADAAGDDPLKSRPS